MKLRTSKFLVLLLSPLILNACSSARGDESEEITRKLVQTQVLEQVQLTEKLSLTGVISGQGQTVLSTKSSGRIEAVYADVGDRVKRGDILVKLSGDEAMVALQNARNTYQNSLANLSQTRALLSAQVDAVLANTETLKLRLKALENTRISVDTTTEQQVRLAEEQVTLTQARLDNVNRSLDHNESELVDQKESLITQSVILTHNVLDQLYGILNLSSESLDFETSLDKRFGQTSSQSRTDSLLAMKDLRDRVDNLESYYNNFIKDNQATEDSISEGFDLAESTLKDTKEVLQTVHTLLVNTVSSVNLSQSQLDGLRSTIVGLGQQVESLNFDQLSQSGSGLDVERENQKAEFLSQLNIANHQLLLARENRRQQLTDIDDNLLILKSQIAEAERNYQTTLANQNAQVQLLKTQSDQAKGQMNMSEVAYENTLLKAPEGGIILNRIAEEGSIVSAGMPMMEFANPASIKIETELAEDEAYELSVGLESQFTVDSLPGESFSARISRIGLHADSLTRKVPVEFEILSDSEKLKIGNFVRLELSLGDEKKLLILPNSALLKNGEEESVFIIQNDSAYEIPVKTGRRIDDGIEILSGVYAANEVVIGGLENLRNADAVEIYNPRS